LVDFQLQPFYNENAIFDAILSFFQG